jgi:hypothetical protein
MLGEFVFRITFVNAMTSLDVAILSQLEEMRVNLLYVVVEETSRKTRDEPQ